MTKSVANSAIASRLQSINNNLAELLRTEPADVSFGADGALEDGLVVCGILGGKDVGKSTLINALARTRVSLDSAEVGRGTVKPIAYAHKEMQDSVAHRLKDLARVGSFELTLHEADAIRNVVLVDLPDFDSEFLEHLRLVRQVSPLLDRVLWVQTPRKLGDRALVEMLTSVIKDPDNVHWVLNKFDELLSDLEPCGPERPGSGEPNEVAGTVGEGDNARLFWDQHDKWVESSMATAGCTHDAQRRFMVSAAFPDTQAFVDQIGERWDDSKWSRFEAELGVVREIAALAARDLDRLRSHVLSEVTAEQTRSIKRANLAREQQINARRISSHHDLDNVALQLGQYCDPDYQQRILGDVMGPTYCRAVAVGLNGQLRSETELADELLERRVEAWPLLRLAYWPLGWLSRSVGRRISRSSTTRLEAPVDPFLVEGHSLVERIELMRSRGLSDHSVILSRLELDSSLPEADQLASRCEAHVGRLVPSLEKRLVSELREKDPKPSFVGKGALWLILLWFPVLQPILSAGLAAYGPSGEWRLAYGALRIVAAFSATHLLAALATVASTYLAILAGMYVRSLRTIRRELDRDGTARIQDLLADAVDRLLVEQVVAPLANPCQDRLDRLCYFQSSLRGFETGRSETNVQAATKTGR